MVLVYGDHENRVDPAAVLNEISDELEAIWGMAPGLDRHARLVGALIEAGMLLQGVEDAGLSADELCKLVRALARDMVQSVGDGFATLGARPEMPASPTAEKVVTRLPEGFAFYAVYPEAYAAAARRFRLLGPPVVIGIRSIGTTLGAVVAAALGAERWVSVRPFGHPFARRVELPKGVIEKGAHYVIVDEGPGQSGSSFGAVADWLEAHGIPAERIAFLPSHEGELGPHGSDEHRRRWAKAQRQAALFDPGWLERRFGPIDQVRTADPWQRLSFRGCAGPEPVLIRFAGLGRIGERKFAMGRELALTGFVPEPLAWAHGFIVERWYGDRSVARPPAAYVADYINVRARLFPAGQESGASLTGLLEMVRRNSLLALGESASAGLNDWGDRCEALQARVRPVRVDGRMDGDRWIDGGDRCILKLDALDHHQGHDLVGCQDAAWDVAGAISELNLTEAQAATLIGRTRIDCELLAFYRIAYEAFRLGRATVAAGMAASQAAPFQAEARRRAERLDALLLQCS